MGHYGNGVHGNSSLYLDARPSSLQYLFLPTQTRQMEIIRTFSVLLLHYMPVYLKNCVQRLGNPCQLILVYRNQYRSVYIQGFHSFFLNDDHDRAQNTRLTKHAHLQTRLPRTIV